MSQEIFSRSNDGKIKFTGEFDKLYNEESDPWEQSLLCESDMSSFYQVTRNRLAKFIRKNCCNINSICEVGSGTGYVTKLLANEFNGVDVSGCDISQNAVNLSIQNFKNLNFYKHDILKAKLPCKYDVIILSNILWYIIHDFDSALLNSIMSLNRENNGGAYLIIQNALFKSGQEYALELVNSPGTLMDYIGKSLFPLCQEYSMNVEYLKSDDIKHDFVICSVLIK